MNLPTQSETTVVDWRLADEDVMIRKVTTEAIRYMVTRLITCGITGNVLDYRTCVAYADEDGDVLYVADPSVDDDETRQRLRKATRVRYAVVR
ncbi:hypothetical protein PQD13_gp05 [Gordonia phage Clawz]|uniref:Uncharacterized protein n=1 Tax=Gordonia phage Clawz TaxID=2743910 RepID=A0AAE7F9L6_9CAUD|nr:hypothetical protein PQD13_gp05 [Gordonia phage Clawz]QKY79917.1 hypothetical protein SEA_CLAWZ_5 [Gordonia phage Clawz]